MEEFLQYTLGIVRASEDFFIETGKPMDTESAVIWPSWCYSGNIFI